MLWKVSGILQLVMWPTKDSMQVVFPAAHVCQRLEQAAAGLWPETGPMAAEEGTVQDALLRVSSTVSDSARSREPVHL